MGRAVKDLTGLDFGDGHMLTPAQFAEKHGVVPATVRKWIADKRLDAEYAKNGRIFIPADAELKPIPQEVKERIAEQQHAFYLRRTRDKRLPPAVQASLAEGRVLTADQFAQKHGVPVHTVRNWIANKQLDVERQKNGRVLIPADAEVKPIPPEVRQRLAEQQRTYYRRKVEREKDAADTDKLHDE